MSIETEQLETAMPSAEENFGFYLDSANHAVDSTRRAIEFSDAVIHFLKTGESKLALTLAESDRDRIGQFADSRDEKNLIQHISNIWHHVLQQSFHPNDFMTIAGAINVTLMMNIVLEKEDDNITFLESVREVVDLIVDPQANQEDMMKVQIKFSEYLSNLIQTFSLVKEDEPQVDVSVPEDTEHVADEQTEGTGDDVSLTEEKATTDEQTDDSPSA